MDFELSDDQSLLRETTQKFVEGTCSLSVVRRLAETEPRGFDADWWRQGAELGWTSMLVAEADGGGSVSDHGLVDLSLIAEERGRLVSPGPFVPVNVVAEAIARSGTADQRQAHLPGLLDGGTIASWVLAAPAAGLAPGGTLRARWEDGGGMVLQGVTDPVESAGQADLFLITASGPDGGVVQVLVRSDAAGLGVRGAKSLDLVRRFAEVTFDQVRVGADEVLGVAKSAGDAVEHQLETAVVLQCAELAGIVDQVLQMTVEYSFDRYSFGRPLASYQALKHRFADMRMWVEACFATVEAAARAVATDASDAAELVSVAKAYIGEKAPAIVQDCIQLHGGIGVTWDHDLHLYLRRVVVDRTQLGTPADHRERVARIMGLDTDATSS